MPPTIEDCPDVPFEVKEWHFHVYFFLGKDKSTQEAALSLRSDIKKLHDKGYFTAVPLEPWGSKPYGPHPIGSYEVWVPIESFPKVHSYMEFNRGKLSVMIHPLTRYEILDHTDRASWLGEKVPLDLFTLKEDLGFTPLQYPELKLGYSNPSLN